MPSFDMIGEYGDLSSKNQLIHGDNLDALRVIADDFETHPDAEKIKCIYIDPPYNTRKELKNYSDNFDRNEWQAMMRPRLILMRQILCLNGIICIQLDDSEHAYLGNMMNEIFGVENYLATIIWRRRQSQANLSRYVSTIHDYILIYAKDKSEYTGPAIQDTLWIEPTVYGYNQIASNEIESYFGDKTAFETPKPELLLYHILELTTQAGDWVLDGFLGSGTTAAVAQKMNRQWIGIEAGEQAETLCTQRLLAVLKESEENQPIGITKLIHWNGGGGFKTYRVSSNNSPAEDLQSTQLEWSSRDQIPWVEINFI